MANTAKKTNPSDEPANMQVVKNASPTETGRDVQEEGSNPAPEQAPRVNPLLSLEQKIQKVADLNMLIEKYQKLAEARRNLQSFKLGTDGMSTTVILRDTSSGNDFKTSHSSVVAVVIADMQRILKEKICEVERLIEF